jgi:hypothetical protein
MMDIALRRVIWSCLSHLSKDDRQEAVEMLVFIGLLNTQTFKVDISKLRHAFNAYSNGMDHNRDEKLLDYGFEQRRESNTFDKSRQFRLNSMSSYPFQDEYGTVDEVLNAKQSTIHLSQMGAPARARIITVTYNSMLNGRKSIKVNNVPDALAELGVSIPSKILGMIHCLGIQLDNIVLEKNINVPISIEAFINLVELCLNPKKYLQLSKSKHKYELDSMASVSDEGTVITEVSHSEEPPTRHVRRQPTEVSRSEKGRTSRDRGGIYQETQSSRMKRHSQSPEREAVIISRNHTGNKQHVSYNEYRDTHAFRLRQAKSKITAEVRSDRDRHAGSRQGILAPTSDVVPIRFENLLVQVDNSSSEARGRVVFSEDLSHTSSVIQSAEAFLRTSTTMPNVGSLQSRLDSRSNVASSPLRQVLHRYLYSMICLSNDYCCCRLYPEDSLLEEYGDNQLEDSL